MTGRKNSYSTVPLKRSTKPLVSLQVGRTTISLSRPLGEVLLGEITHLYRLLFDESLASYYCSAGSINLTGTLFMSSMAKIMIISLATFSSLAFSASSYASCTLADLAGTWQAYVFSANIQAQAFWNRCTINMNPSGSLATGSACQNSAGQTGQLTGQVILLSSVNCIFRGRVFLAGSFNELTWMTMNRSKDHIDGTGGFNQGIFIFNMTRP